VPIGLKWAPALPRKRAVRNLFGYIGAMLIRGQANPPSLTTIVLVVSLGLLLVVLGAVGFGLALIGIFAAISLIEYLFARYYR
jgi:hypothetical protein